MDPGVDGFGGAEYAHQGIEHVAAENPQPTAHVRRLVEVLGEVLAGQCRTAGGNGHDLTDEPGLDQVLCPGHGFGESDVVADLHDEVRVSGLGITQLNQIVHRAATGLLHHHRLAGGECPHGVGHHVATLGVDHDRVDPLVIENFVDGARFEVVLVREVLQARIVVGGRNHLDVVNLSERSHPRRCVRMGDPEEADHDGFGHHRLLTFLVLRGLHRLENRGADCRWWSPGP